MKMELNPDLLPQHIAIILDGNGRWAKKRNLPRNLGHRKGAFNLKDITNECDRIGIKYLTVYCFSSENWSRPKAEVDYLFTQPIKYFRKYRKQLANSSVIIKFIGRRDRVSPEFLECMETIERETAFHTGITLTIACDYGSYEEITLATKKIVQEVLDGKMNCDEITPQTITNYLYTASLPPLDLLIRTSGEIRLSNFLLWQVAYAEMYFTDTYWPDFDAKELRKALLNYQNRERRFGGLKEVAK